MYSKVPISELSTLEVLEPLRALVDSERETLAARYIGDTVDRYTGTKLHAQEALEGAMHLDAINEFYNCNVFFEHDKTVAPSSGVLFGLETIMRGLKVSVLTIPLPVRVARRVGPAYAYVPLSYRGANITAWTADSHQEQLGWAYKSAVNELKNDEGHNMYLPWTIEPKKAIGFIGPMLEEAGMIGLESEGLLIKAGKSRRYDVGLDKPAIPPRSILYGDQRLNKDLIIPKIP